MNELIDSNKKIVYWLNVENSKKKIDNWLSFSQIHDHFCWFTMRIMKNFFIFFKKKFIFWRFSFDSRIFTNDSTIFFWFAYFYKWFDDFLLICVFLQMIWRFSLITRVFLRAYLTILFFLFAYFDEQFIIYRNKTFDRISINFAKLKAKNLLYKKQ